MSLVVVELSTIGEATPEQRAGRVPLVAQVVVSNGSQAAINGELLLLTGNDRQVQTIRIGLKLAVGERFSQVKVDVPHDVDDAVTVVTAIVVVDGEVVASDAGSVVTVPAESASAGSAADQGGGRFQRLRQSLRGRIAGRAADETPTPGARPAADELRAIVGRPAAGCPSAGRARTQSRSGRRQCRPDRPRRRGSGRAGGSRPRSATCR